MNRLYAGIPPLVFSTSDYLTDFSGDALGILDAAVDAGGLVVDVTYGGGCARHDLDAVAFGGWMESSPVRIRVGLTHDAHGDVCKASIRRTLRFDLEPLRRAYAQAYGSDTGTVVLLVQPGNLSLSVAPREVLFTF